MRGSLFARRPTSALRSPPTGLRHRSSR